MLENLVSSCTAPKNLPEKPDAVVLEGKIVKLVPFNRDLHAEDLYKISNGSSFTINDIKVEAFDANDLIWKYMFGGPFPDLNSFSSFISDIANRKNNLLFCVVDKRLNHPIGLTCLMNNFPEHLSVELGHVWYSPIAQRTGANLETCYLLLSHMFSLGYKRVEWKSNFYNKRSMDAAYKIGFTLEMVQKNHSIVKKCNRDTAWLSIIDTEWDSVKVKLSKKIYERETLA